MRNFGRLLILVSCISLFSCDNDPEKNINNINNYNNINNHADAGDDADVDANADAGEDGEVDADADAEVDADAGLPPDCPEMLARARIFNSSDGWENQLTVGLFNRVEFDVDPAWEAQTEVTYRWTIVDHPAGFLGSFLPNATMRSPNMDMTIPGDYLFHLDVTDGGGVPVCPPSQINVQVRSAARLVVELVWTTPADDDETDEAMGVGTDVDLHMIRAGGTWDDTSGASDCSFRAPHPNWGSPTETADNPSLDRDDTDGGGPETITVLSPAITFGPGMEYFDSPYQVGVYFFEGYTFGEVYASLRVYLEGDPNPIAVWPSVPDDGGSHPDGRLFRGRRLLNSDQLSLTGDFWLAGEIDWTSSGAVLRERDELTPGFP